MAVAVEADEALNATHVSLFGADAVVLEADPVRHTGEQVWCIREIHGMTNLRMSNGSFSVVCRMATFR
jgi:hypothetical protein